MSEGDGQTCGRCGEEETQLIEGYDGRRFCADCCEMAGGASMPVFLRKHERVVLKRLAGPLWRSYLGISGCAVLALGGLLLGFAAYQNSFDLGDFGALVLGLTAALLVAGGTGFGLRLVWRSDPYEGWRLSFDRRHHPGRIRFQQRSRAGRLLFEAWGDFERLREWLERRRDTLDEQQSHSPDLARCVALAYLHLPPARAEGTEMPFPARARATNAFRLSGRSLR